MRETVTVSRDESAHDSSRTVRDSLISRSPVKAPNHPSFESFVTLGITRPVEHIYRRSLDDALGVQSVSHILERRLLCAHYQPIVQLKDGVVMGHESLIRGPEGSSLRTSDALFRQARHEDLTVRLEQACLREGLQGWVGQTRGTRLFLNLSAHTIVQLGDRATLVSILQSLHAADVTASALVVEITEHEHVTELPRLIEVATAMRAQGFRFALDDFGDGRSSLRLWAELRPEFVKIDKYFVRDLPQQAVKVQTLHGIMRFAESFGTELIAEGIETDGELQVLRDLGITLGQGYYLGRPQAEPAKEILEAARRVIASSATAVLPELTRAAAADFTVARLAIPAPVVSPETPVDEVARLFSLEPSLRALAVVEDDRPLGVITRQAFVDRYAKPFFRELYGRKPCLPFANGTPLVLDRHSGLDAMTAVLTSSDQRYLTEGFVVIENGRYIGLGNGEQLVRVVTEARIEAARHANPLTFLPGNVPIAQHITRLLANGATFVACYCDLNDFKPFNDHYGYWRGDEMIRLVARTLASHCDARRDFVGHVGGDDFVVLFQSDDWMERCTQLRAAFESRARLLYDEIALERGGIDAEDRHGVPRFFPCTTLAVGAVPVTSGRFSHPEDVAAAAAAAKHKAKQARSGFAIEDLVDPALSGGAADDLYGGVTPRQTSSGTRVPCGVTPASLLK